MNDAIGTLKIFFCFTIPSRPDTPDTSTTPAEKTLALVHGITLADAKEMARTFQMENDLYEPGFHAAWIPNQIGIY